MNLKLLFILMTLSVSLQAQYDFSPFESTHEATVNLSDPFNQTLHEKKLINNSTDSTDIRFEIFNINAPSEWEIQFNTTMDGFGFGWSWGLTTNIDADINIPNPLAVGDSTIMDLRIRPKDIAGCGTYEVRVALVSDTSNIVATGIYHFKINAPDCTTSFENLESQKIKIFPNPTREFFNIKGSSLIEEIQIFNIVGNLMLETAYQNGTATNISSFPNGVYLVRMLDGNKNIVNTSRLIKQ